LFNFGKPLHNRAGKGLDQGGTPYYYEAMATTNDWFLFKSKISRPDFYLPQYNLYVEYWGLVDSPDPGTRDNYIRTCAGNGPIPQEQHCIHLNILQ
jgi:hypothetical protein